MNRIMKMWNCIGLCTGLMILTLASVVKADDIYLGEPGYNGTGCPKGTASTVLSPDAKQLSILFNEYAVEVEGPSRTARKTCNIGVPIHVPQGLSVSVLQVDYRGYNSLPRGADSRLDASYFFADRPGPSTSRTFLGELDDNFYASDKLLATALVWSRCGQDVNLRVNSAMRVKTNRRGDQAIATVDSVDISAGMLFLLQWKRCN